MSTSWLQGYVDKEVVAEIGDGFTVFGTLIDVDDHHLLFADADLHHQGEANSSRDVYALETRDLGIRRNRERLAVPQGRLIAIALLREVSA